MKFRMVVIAAMFVAWLCALGVIASAQTYGSASGRCVECNADNMGVQGVMFDPSSAGVFGFHVRLHGGKSGVAFGAITSLPKPGSSEYQLRGTFTTRPDDCICVAMDIVIDVGSADFPMPIVVGRFDAIIHPVPWMTTWEPQPKVGVVPTSTPWPPYCHRHFQGRWQFF